MSKSKSASVVSTEYEYDPVRVEGKDGKVKHTRTNGDAIATAMLHVTAGTVSIERVIRDNKLEQKPDQYDNQGLLRMSVGNSLRGLVRNGTPVKIGDVTIKSLDQRVAAPMIAKDPAPKKAKKTRAKRKPAEQTAEAA